MLFLWHALISCLAAYILPSGCECKVFDREPTGEAFCSPTCEKLNPCRPHEDCVIEEVQCVGAPCPGSLHCKNSDLLHAIFSCVMLLLVCICINCTFPAVEVTVGVQLYGIGLSVNVIHIRS